MDLFSLNMSNKSVVEIKEAAILRIPEFKRLVNRDRGSVGDADGRKKYRALKELTFIWYYCSFNSPIFDRPDHERWEESLKTAQLKDKDIDVDVQAGIDAYKKYTNVISLRLYDAALQGCTKLEQHFKNIDFEQLDEFGKRVNNPKDFVANLKSLQDALKSLQEVKKMVVEDLATNTVKMRGGSKKGNREDPS